MEERFIYFSTHFYHLLPYISLVIIFVALWSLSEVYQKAKAFKVVALFVLILFSGLKAPVSPDLKNYVEFFENPSTMTAYSIELGNIILFSLIHEITNYPLLFLTYAFLTMLFIYLSLRKFTPYVGFSLLIYLLTPGFFLNQFVELRQQLALAIFLYAIAFLISDRNRLMFILYGIIAILFHHSAMLALISILIFDSLKIYKLIDMRIGRIIFILTIFFSLYIGTDIILNLTFSLIAKFIPKYAGYYFMYIYKEGITTPVPILKLSIYNTIGLLFLFIINYLKFKSDRDRYVIMYIVSLFILGVISLNLAKDSNELSRISYYLLIYQIIIFPFILMRLNTDNILRYIFSLIVIIFYFVQFIYGLFYIAPNGELVFLPYRNILFDLQP